MAELKALYSLVLLLLTLPVSACIAGFESNPEYQPTLPVATLEGTVFIKCEERLTIDGREPRVKKHNTYTEEYLRKVLFPAPFTGSPDEARFILDVNLRRHADDNILNHIVSGATFGIIPLYVDHRYELGVKIRDKLTKSSWDFRAEAKAFAWEGWLLIPAYPFANFIRVEKTIKEKLVSQLMNDMEQAGIFAPLPPP